MRGSMVEPSTMMLNESMTMTANIGAGGPLKVMEDDVKSIVPQPPKPKAPKFPTTFANEQEIVAAK